MNEITAEAATPPNTENVAAFLAYCANDCIDDGGNLWFPIVKADEDVVEIAIKPADEAGDALDEVIHFRAVVVEGETEPIVLPRPALDDGFAFEGDPYDTSEDVDGWQVCAAEANGRTTMLRLADSILFRGCGHISTAEARRFAAALVAKADAVEAAQSQTGGAS